MHMEYNFDKLIPHNLVNDNLLRYGNKNDGGYIFPENIINNSKVLVSLGIKDDWTFEKDYIRGNNKKVVAYDLVTDSTFFFKCFIILLLNFKIKKSLIYFFKIFEFPLFFYIKNNVHYRKVGVSNTKRNFITLQSIFDTNNLNSSIFSIDIEGDEYSIIEDLIKNESKIDAFTIEFHDIEEKLDLFFKSLDKISSKFKLVHYHPNNNSRIIFENKLTDCIELTFINLKYKTEKKNKFKGPIDIDKPCNPEFPEINIYINKTDGK